jgi:benzoate transport
MTSSDIQSDTGRKITPYQIWTLLALTVLNMQDGFDILAISYAATAITEEWNISRANLGVVFSAGLFGMMVGALFLSRVADKVGRKPVAVMGLCLSGIGMLVAMFAPTIDTLIIGRVLTGIGVGGILVSLNTLVAEYAGKKYRGIAIAIFQLGFATGAFLSGFIAAYLLDIANWRYIFGFGAMTSFLFIPIILSLPESNSFLAKSNKPNALILINKGRQKFGLRLLKDLPINEEGKSVSKKKNNSLALLSTEYWLKTVLICSCFFMLLTLLYFMLTWTPKILVDMGFSEADGNRGGRLINLTGMLGVLVIGLFSLRVLPSMIVGLYLAMLSLVLLFFGVLSPLVGGVFVLIGVAGFMLHGSMIGLYSTVPALYPVELRATGTGWAIGLSRLGAVLGPALAGILLDRGWLIMDLFKVYSILAAFAAIIAIILWAILRREQTNSVAKAF